MDKYGNKFFENLEEELPRKLPDVTVADTALTVAQCEPAGLTTRTTSSTRRLPQTSTQSVKLIVSQLPDRARMARVDVIHGRQVTS
jgi:hypothetical protein